jgi:1-acyl-sn-glycerol-3-phosphate acyltransferase
MMYWVVRAVFFAILKLFFRFRVEGGENLPKNTNFIVVSNHTSFLDPAIIGAAMPVRIFWLVLRDLYMIGWVKWLISITRSVPVGMATERAVYLLNKGRNIGLFPEGGISRDGKLKPFRRGAAVLAHRTGRPIVPCAIFGAYEVLPLFAKMPKMRPITLRIGKPVYLLKEFHEVIDDIYLQEGMLKVQKAIKEMLDEHK